MLFIQHPEDLLDSSGRNKVPTSPARPHQHVHDDWRCRHTLSSTALQDRHFLRHSLSAEKHTCLVLALQARQSPNTQDQAGRLKAATGHLFEVTSFNWYCGEVPSAKLQKVSSEDRRTTFRVQAVNQSTEMRSVLDFFATAQSLFPFFVLATEAHEDPNTSRQSRESQGETRSTEHALNGVVGKVPVRSCRECHRKT